MVDVFGLEVASKYIYTLLILAISVLVHSFFKYLINRLLIKKIKMDNRKQQKLYFLFSVLLKYIIIIVVLVFILNFFGINSAALIASVSVVGLVVGLAFQDILKDILAGILILINDQYAVGDLVEIGGFKGKVIALGLRMTKIKSYSGEVKMIANRQINDVINFSLYDAMVIIDVNIAYDTNLDLADKVFKELVVKLSKDKANITGDFKLLGIDKISPVITYRLAVPSKPAKQEVVKRNALREIKMTLDKYNLKRW